MAYILGFFAIDDKPYKSPFTKFLETPNIANARPLLHHFYSSFVCTFTIRFDPSITQKPTFTNTAPQ